MIAVLQGWDGKLQVINKDEKHVLGARIVETDDGPKVKLS